MRMTQEKYSPLEFRSWSYLLNVLLKYNACPASGRQAARHESVCLLPYKQWPCNYKLHCIFHLVTKDTFFRLLHREPLQHRLKIELTATGRPLQKELNFYTWSGNYTNLYHGVRHENGWIKQDIMKKLNCVFFEEME
jgi:hypothetical protein